MPKKAVNQTPKQTGGRKVKLVEVTNSIQDAINEDLRARVDISAFTQEYVQELVVNTVGLHCKRCNSDQINVISKQTRSSDEATSKFYTCLNCGNKWRQD